MDEQGESGGSERESVPPPPETIMFKRPARKFDASIFNSKELPPRPEGDVPPSPAPPPAAAAAAIPLPSAGLQAGLFAALPGETSTPLSPKSPTVPLDVTGIVFKRPARKVDASIFAKELTPEELARLEAETTSSRSLPPVPNPAPEMAQRPSPFATPAAPAPAAVASPEESITKPGVETGTEAGTPHYLSSLGGLGSRGTTGGGGGGPDPERASNVMSEIARHLRESRKDPGKASLFGKGEAAATALAAVASILGSAVLQAVLTPSEIIFQQLGNGMYPYAFCSDNTHPRFCGRMRATYSLCCIITLIFELLCLLATIIVTIGMNTWLTMAYSFFILSILSQTVALIAASWLAFPTSAAIGGTALFIIFLFTAAFFVLPGIALAWHFRFGLSKTLTLEKAPAASGGPSRAPSGIPESLHHSGLRDFLTSGKLSSKPSSGRPTVIEGSTVLHWAAYKGGARHRLLLSVLLAAGESVDIPAQGADAGGWTPLHIAAYRGNEAIVRQLIGAGANVELTEAAHARTALHFAALKGHVAVVHELLKAGADPAQLDVVGNTPLELARLAGHSEAVEAIRGFQREKLNAELLTAVKWRKSSRVRQLLEAKADANAVDARGTSALTWAANRGFAEGVEELLAKGANVNCANSHGSTPLIEAAMAGHADTVRLLLENGANLRAKFRDTEETAITVAARRGHFEVVEVLLDASRAADPLEQQPSVVRRRDVDEAALNRHGAVLRLLLSHRPKAMTLLQSAACIGSVPAVKLFLEKGELAREQGSEVTALHYAAQEGYADVVRELLLGGADHNVCDKEGRLPLHWAALEDHAAAARELVHGGAALEVRDGEGGKGLTPLLMAAKSGRAEVAEVLLAAGADANARDAAGRTALHLAVLHRHQAVVEALIAHHADFTSVDSDNRTPLESARAMGNAIAAERLARATPRPGARRRSLPV